MKVIRILGFGLLNYLIRFAIGGFLYMNVKMDPTGFWYGFILTAVAFIFTLVFLKYVIRPVSTSDGVKTILVWFVIVLVLDAITARPIVHIDVAYLFSEIQTWTRSLIMFVTIPFAIKKQP